VLPQDVALPGVGVLPFGLYFDGQHMWVANSASGTLSSMDTDGRILATYSAGGGPAKLTSDGESLWVTNTADNTVSKITFP
jgi:DNA-binding beta-propeller fold protein YncE